MDGLQTRFNGRWQYQHGINVLGIARKLPGIVPHGKREGVDGTVHDLFQGLKVEVVE